MTPSRYHFHERRDLLDLVPRSARSIVDVGCGAGVFGAAIKAHRPGVVVRGIEPDAREAAKARRVLDDVAIAAADEAPSAWPIADCLIFADVLEHLLDPWATLRSWRARVDEGAAIVVSVPNVAHWSVLVGALRGGWDYADAGVLDRTHLRFFTGATIVESIDAAGFEVTEVHRVIDRLPNRWRKKLGLPEDDQRFSWRTRTPSRGARWRERALDLLTYQFFVVGRAR